jgi:hypothetical protein
MIAQTAFLDLLFIGLWQEYRDRVEHARAYEELLKRCGGSFQNDHLAFRS